MHYRIIATALFFCVSACCFNLDRVSADEPKPPEAFRTRFFELCNLAMDELDKPVVPWREKYRENEEPKTHHVPFFEDSYAVRGLCVAYDMTGEKKYLDACTRWTDMVVDFQKKMKPAGAYYLNYGKFRRPGENEGWWFVADASTVASAVLAVAVRAEGEQREKYLESVKAYARLVIDNYVGEGGGINNGSWWEYEGEWWCSTSTYGTFLLHLHVVTGKDEYLKVAMGCVDWMNAHGVGKSEPAGFTQISPGIALYAFEFYAAALPYLKADGPRRRTVEKHVAEYFKWLDANQKTRGAKTDWKYLQMGKTYMSAMPYVTYLTARELPQYRDQVAAADRELLYVTDLLFPVGGRPRLTNLHQWEFSTWAMMSYAERLHPGAVFRAKQQP
ncbi:MAG: hypothetical protein JW959_12755 [Pirellulales bacterium]|nr:hypothetical protein [Pirellulales bacterium]